MMGERVHEDGRHGKNLGKKVGDLAPRHDDNA
jgi:hypothetical protein